MQSVPDKAYWIWLASVPGVGARRFSMLNKCFDSPRTLWESQEKEIIKFQSTLGERAIKSIVIIQSKN